MMAEVTVVKGSALSNTSSVDLKISESGFSVAITNDCQMTSEGQRLEGTLSLFLWLLWCIITPSFPLLEARPCHENLLLSGSRLLDVPTHNFFEALPNALAMADTAVDVRAYLSGSEWLFLGLDYVEEPGSRILLEILMTAGCYYMEEYCYL